MKEVYARIYDLARPLLNVRCNDTHVAISLRFAWELIAVTGADEAVVIPAILLHDIGWTRLPEELHAQAFGLTYDRALNRVHEVEGARMARDILASIGYDPALTDEIVDIIEGHDSRPEALSLNDRVVKDADKLWRFTREGFGIDSERFDIPPGPYAEALAARLGGWFFTAQAAAMARAELAQRRKEAENQS